MAYSEQFYKEILDNMPEVIKNYFDTYVDELSLGCYSFEEFVKESIEEVFMNYSRRESLAPIAAKLLKAKRAKVSRICTLYKELFEFKPESPKNPLFFLKDMPKSDILEKYGRIITYEEAKADAIKKCEDWKSSKGYITSFSKGLERMSKTICVSSIKIDISLFFWDYVEKNYNGNPSSFYVKRILPDVPLIGLKSHKEDFPQPVNSVSDSFASVPLTVASSDGVLVKINPSDFLLKNLRSLDPDCIMVLSSIINNISDMQEFCVTRTVKIPLYVIEKDTFSYNNEHSLNKILSIITYLSLLKVEYVEKGSITSSAITIFDKISFPVVGDNKWVEVRFSQEVASDIVGDSVYSFPKKDYVKLSNPASKILCHSLKKEQKRVNSETIDLMAYYDYSYFVGKVRFDSSSRRENFKVIKAAFDDYINNNVMVASYNIEGVEGIHVKYLPMELSVYDEF